MILRNHGLLTVGSTVDEAGYLYTLLERSCEVQLLAEAAAANGVQKVYVPDESAKYTYDMSSDPETLYWEAQPDMVSEPNCESGESLGCNCTFEIVGMTRHDCILVNFTESYHRVG